MIINIPFQRKEADIDPEPCTIEGVVEISADEFQYFKTHLMKDYDFLMNNREKMGYSEDGVRHCLLVLPQDGDDGILVDTQGANYARYSSYLPNARQMMSVGQYQSLYDFVSEMYRQAQSAVDKVLKNQQDGAYCLKEATFPDRQTPLFSYPLLGEMLSERPEFSSVNVMGDEMLIAVAPEHMKENIDLSKYRQLTEDDVDIMLAKHIAKQYYGYDVAIIDLRNPTKSDGNNLLHLVNKYMDEYKKHPDNIALKAKAEKYAKIIGKTLIFSDGDAASYGQNAFFYDAAEGLLTAVILYYLLP